MTHDELMSQVMSDLISENSSWESKARGLRGGLRMLRADMDITLESTGGIPPYQSVDWREEFKSVRDSVDQLLKGVVGE